ncbi:hypothetical protein [Lactobacillus sp. Sy-1]|uniref:hypothetical protein n=1 Tax=Lactobacillus sp. Sy-1 TaxID=2109645 RepID=UPI001C5B9BA3|nr:hypothetical protein [Lactobacillus sp. Sy-1]MBW1606196.1 hypothetical protein [Lactobacillus sp. Sy-1]
MKKYGLLALAVFSPIISIILFFNARVCYKNYYYLSHLYRGDLKSDIIGTPSGEIIRMWLSLLFGCALLIIFLISLYKYLRLDNKE